MVDRNGLSWFFGYGSLMWNPGFTHDAFEAARLDGWHRRFCIVSRHYRGTAEHPGLVLGLAPGGSCVGRALGVMPDREAEVIDYLDDREQIGGVYVYERRRLPIRLLDDSGTVDGWCYLADTAHPDYAGAMGTAEVERRIATAAGIAGSNRAYLEATLAHLGELGIEEPELAALARASGGGPAC